MKNGFVPILLVLLTAGCTDRALELKRQEWQMQRETLADSLDNLQARLLADQARVRLWQELRARHEQVAMAISEQNDINKDRAGRGAGRGARLAMLHRGSKASFGHTGP